MINKLETQQGTTHSHTGEPRIGIVSKLETQKHTTTTHKLESQGQALLAGEKYGKTLQPLTN